MFNIKRGNSSRGEPVRSGPGIAFRLSFWILLSAAIIFTLVFGFSYTLSRGFLVEKIEQYADVLAQGTAARIDRYLAATRKIPENYALMMADQTPGSPKKLLGQMESILANNEEIFGMAVAFEPDAWADGKRHFSPYVFKGQTGIEATFITYDYFSWDWYKLPRQDKRPVWVEPYFDEGGGNIVMSTYAVPFYRLIGGRKTFSGIVTVDVSLARLRQIVSEIQIGKTGYAFLISQNGTYVTHPDTRLIMKQTIFGLADEKKDLKLRDIGTKMTARESGFIHAGHLMTGQDCWLAYAPLASTGWSLGLVFPQDELMADVSRHYHLTLLFGALGLLILFFVIIWIANGITSPLRMLTQATRRLAEGDLDVKIPAIRRTDEVGQLASSFATMRESLQRYIRDLTQTTAAKERIESELKIAHDIQMGILPRLFPPFPERSDMDIYATLRPAREVGGDLYDFFFMDEDHLCFTVGDVSGKGVPAALLMAVTKILIKSKATQGLSADAILSRVNEDLSLDNPSMMFVTLFLGILNVRTGEVVYCNGGHPPPYILRDAGEITPLATTGGMALGVMGDFQYRCATVTLQKNDTLFLYSDGVTEANDARFELFGDQRLAGALAGLHHQSLKTIIDGVMVIIEAFAQNEPQADDITMLVVRYFGVDEGDSL
jgi:sigma-B regulation protein RsbU (phosphoserine phosphatase)